METLFKTILLARIQSLEPGTHLAAKVAEILGVLRDLHLLDNLTQAGTVAGTDPNLLRALGLWRQPQTKDTCQNLQVGYLHVFQDIAPVARPLLPFSTMPLAPRVSPMRTIPLAPPFREYDAKGGSPQKMPHTRTNIVGGQEEARSIVHHECS